MTGNKHSINKILGLNSIPGSSSPNAQKQDPAKMVMTRIYVNGDLRQSAFRYMISVFNILNI